MKRRTLSALLGLLGAVSLIVSNVAIERHAIAPVPIQQLGLPAEAVEPLKQFVASLPQLHVVGAASDADNRSQRVVLDSHLLRVGGGKWPWHGPQETGDCAAQAIAGGIEIDTAVQSEEDPEIVWRPVDRGAIYGGGRVTIGKGAIRGAGLVPSWGLQYVDQFGILWQDESGVPPYSGRRMDEWGRSGVPAKFLELMKPFAGLQFAACRSAQDVCNAINAGHPVVFGSMRWGTDRITLVEGRNLAFDTTDWPHAQIVTGYDGTLANGQKLFRFLNSWGPNAHSPKSQMPGDHPGAYYVTWQTMDDVCREGMAFAVSGANGFRQRQFVPDFSVIGAADPLPVAREESAIMFPLLPPSVQLPGTVLGCACIVAAIVLYYFRGNGGRRLGVAALLAVVSLPTIAAAQTPDFQSLTRAAQPTTPVSVNEPETVFDLLTVAAAQPPVAAPNFHALTAAACPCECGIAGCRCDGDCQVRKLPAVKPSSAALRKLQESVEFDVEIHAPEKLRAATKDPRVAQRSAPSWNGYTTFYWPSLGTWQPTPEPGMFYPHAGGVLVPSTATVVTMPPPSARPAGHYERQRVCNGGTCSLQSVWVP